MKTNYPDRTYLSMAAAYTLGVFNDNFFKQAALLLALGAGLAHLQGTATMIFTLPFILCSAYAGWLADRFPILGDGMRDALDPRLARHI